MLSATGESTSTPAAASQKPTLCFCLHGRHIHQKIVLFVITIEEPQGRQVGFIALHIGENGIVPLALRAEKLQHQRRNGAGDRGFVGFGFVDDLLKTRGFVLETLAQVAIERADLGEAFFGNACHLASPLPILGSQSRKPFLVIALAPQLQGTLREVIQTITGRDWHLTQKPVDFWLGVGLNPAFILHQLLLVPQGHLTGFLGRDVPALQSLVWRKLFVWIEKAWFGKGLSLLNREAGGLFCVCLGYRFGCFFKKLRVV